VSSIVKKLIEAFTRPTRSGIAYPSTQTVIETSPDIPLADIMSLYERDPTCKSSVDLLASATVGMGFYTTANEKYAQMEKAKQAVDEFNEETNLDALLNDMARVLIACGNDFWLRITPEKLASLHRLPIDAVEKVKQTYIGEGLKIPYKTEGYKLRHNYAEADKELAPEAVIHWRINNIGNSGFGIGILQVLLHTLIFNSNRRPSYAWMKAKIERIMPSIFEKYAGPDVLALLENAKDEDIKKFESAIRNRPANAALDLQNLLINPIQRYIKRQVERDIFDAVLTQSGFSPAEAKVRLNWGSPETPEVVMADLIKAAELGLIRSEEFRKNATKFGWELWQETEKEVK